jgi:hypothetical protein
MRQTLTEAIGVDSPFPSPPSTTTLLPRSVAAAHPIAGTIGKTILVLAEKRYLRFVLQ